MIVPNIDSVRLKVKGIFSLITLHLWHTHTHTLFGSIFLILISAGTSLTIAATCEEKRSDVRIMK